MGSVEKVGNGRNVFQVETFSDNKLLYQAQVVQFQSWALQDVDAAVAESARRGICERGGVKPPLHQTLFRWQV